MRASYLEAELRSALRREQITADPAALLNAISWVSPDRPLTRELDTILAVSYARGADLWHLAVALFIAPSLDMDFLTDFLTLDARQAETSAALGFPGLA